ncbi:MOSC domain-containing protein [Capillimicrobium parvum]|uniref:MOSC domain-containing protein n=1 Tax=Capillimicrobium parvum TaxID=2884022 RepID=A0A9E6XTG3_9ACTN|nr:MOSC domain-containing protein [Capillimicrobium parvum]UGS34159.1 hypothetical protein DSM104329_00531 [Capillimicrobium parvum]
MKPVAQRTAGRDGALSAAVAALLELELADTPAGRAGAAPLDAWQAWLAARNLQLVQANAPLGSGFWIAVHGERAVVMFGAPPDVVWDPGAGWGRGQDRAGEPAPDVVYVLAALDPALAGLPAEDPGAGTVEAIYVADGSAAPLLPLADAEAIPGRGLRGDRYFYGTGHFSRPGKTGQDLTLIAVEALEALHAESGIALSGAAARRNVVTKGIDVNALVGRRFAIGDVECVGRRWCEPCAHLQRLTEPGVLRGLIHRGGLRADIVSAGRIRVGDRVRALG